MSNSFNFPKIVVSLEGRGSGVGEEGNERQERKVGGAEEEEEELFFLININSVYEMLGSENLMDRKVFGFNNNTETKKYRHVLKDRMVLITLSKVKLKWKISKGQFSKESHFINFSNYSKFVPGYF